MEIEPLNVAIIGCGVISDIYIQSLQDKFKIVNPVACYDRNADKMNAQAEKYHLKALSYEDILADSSIKMVINLTNPAAHYAVTKQALEANKHVFSEKMIAVELEEGQELCRLAKQHHVRLGVAPDTFLGAGIQTAKYIVDKGLIGTPLSAVVSLNRDFDVYADIFPHMNKRGGTLPFDTGCYYMTALASILGPAKRVTSFGRRFRPERIGKRVDKPWFGEKSEVEDDNIMAAAVEYVNGTLVTVHFNSENILTEVPQLDIYGTDGILNMGDPNNFDSLNYLQKSQNEKTAFPFTHGYRENSRGLGAAEMAWSIMKNRPHRASMEMAYHVFELIHGMYLSAKSGQIYDLKSTFDQPATLPTGYVDRGFWGPTQESSLVY
ncbi:oxidoreductase [Lentilactobacillus fungorum]|uniref:Oxidoreductase n=1 Tax=Lentilactobacillus fungorum TaxID=2201250 RepID=A0ABQ3VXJ8_9LACO|nr:Gfo/Idh/MocA family oxidoreductase [Lentilactobacillus fungorum]GHP13275.1 oxidoreductase [Lentilactobacillus fungorum]